jgi:hypothetical protein
MTLNELWKLKEMDESQLLKELIKTAKSSERDIKKVLNGVNWKYAAVRVRANMGDVKVIADAIKDEILKRMSDKRKKITDSLDKEIQRQELNRQKKIMKARKKMKLSDAEEG